MTTSMVEIIIESIREVMTNNNLEMTPVSPETAILSETSLDSLALAELLIILEGKLKKDPFAGGFINFQTVNELARLYE